MDAYRRKRKNKGLYILVVILLFLLFLPLYIKPLLNYEKNKESANVEATKNSLGKIEVQLIRVVDGDTLVVDYNNKNTYLRLIGIDAPESVNPDESKNTPEGIEASNWLKQYLSGTTTVSLEFDIEKYDNYGRLLAYAYIGDTMINKAILDNGHAVPMTIAPNIKYANYLR